MVSSTINLALCGVIGFSHAHMIMNTPQPFGVPAVHLDPLQPDGSDYPCQIKAGTSASAGGASNSMALGSTQPLKFTGQATHGGGSCQVSLTYDNPPTKNSVFKVIHSIEGGCPAKNTPGNMGSDASAADPFTYSFPIPSNIPTGNATIAWSWLNKIGNREFYMNCAPVTLTGTSGDKSNYEALPDILVANIAPNAGCKTIEGQDYKYPNPGSSVESFADDLFFPSGDCGSAGPAASAASGGGAASAPPASAPTSAPAVSPGVFATVPTDGASSPPAQSTHAASAPAGATPAAASPAAVSPTASSAASLPPPPPPPPPPPAASSPPASGGSGTSGTVQSGACTTGQWNCLGTSYQQCGSGIWTPVMALAAGTSCDSGLGSTINIVARSGKEKRIAQRFRS